MAEICKEYKEKIEEKIEKPIDDWVEKSEKKCKKKKCKWWCVCCNKWFCWVVTFLVKVIRWVIVTVAKWVTYLICEVIVGILNILAAVVGLILSIPIIGRILGWILKVLLEIIWSIASIPDILGGLVGIKLPKKLRVCILILSDGEKPMATAESLQKQIDFAKRVYKEEANVSFIVEDIKTLKGSPDAALDTSCDAGAVGDDLLLAGTYFENNSNVQCFDSAFQKLSGFASPVVVFVVRDVKDKSGCSLGPLTDYVTVEGREGTCMAHEVGHACSLWHHDNSNNLMYSACGGDKLKKWQWIWLRRSRHVSFL